MFLSKRLKTRVYLELFRVDPSHKFDLDHKVENSCTNLGDVAAFKITGDPMHLTTVAHHLLFEPDPLH